MSLSTGTGSLNTSVTIRLQMNGRLMLQVQNGKHSGTVFTVDSPTVIGNDPAADLYLDDPLVCPRHARIARDGTVWKIWDLKSENGTFINGKLVSIMPLFPDGEIQIGNTVLRVRYSEEPRVETAMVRRVGEWIELPGIIAHELKNYLQFFDAGIQQIKQDSDVSSHLNSEIGMLQMAGEKMEELVQMLRTGCAEPKPVAMNLSETVLEQIALVESAAQKAGVEVTWDLPASPVMIEADPGQIGRSILNVLKNALEACSRTDTVSINLIPGEHRHRLVIGDTGRGMDPATLAAMWSPMFTTRPDGNGLGAFIAQTAIQRHKGSIRAESQPGKGTVVTIELPGKPV